jgi:hypothetical protein
LATFFMKSRSSSDFVPSVSPRVILRALQQ